MRRVSWLTTAMAVAILVAGLSAQEKPNFSGRWTLLEGVTLPVGDVATGLCSWECTIMQDATSLTVTGPRRTGEPKAIARTFKLDGSEDKRPCVTGQVEAATTAMWDGNKLRISAPICGIGVNIVFSMNDAGQMEVETFVTGATSKPPTLNTYKKH